MSEKYESEQLRVDESNVKLIGSLLTSKGKRLQFKSRSKP